MEKFIFLRELEEYCSRGLTPLHMPGHKRRVEPGPGLPYSIDLTEVDGTDDLHDARGMIERAQERTAALYGSLWAGYSASSRESRYSAISSGVRICSSVSRNSLARDMPSSSGVRRSTMR